MAAKWEFSATDTKALVKRYNKGEGLVALADTYDVPLGTIRRVLVEQGVVIRGRGRPRTKPQTKTPAMPKRK